MRRCVLAVVMLGAVALAAADEPKKGLTKKELGKLMKDAHHGDKSPHARAVAELKKDAPDWAQLAKDAKAFTDMAAAFKGADTGYGSPAKYAESSAALTKAVGDKDKKAAGDAFTGLTRSCSACHSYGAPK